MDNGLFIDDLLVRHGDVFHGLCSIRRVMSSDLALVSMQPEVVED